MRLNYNMNSFCKALYISRIWVEYKKSTNSLPDRTIWLKIEPFFPDFYSS